ncbi:hypothetical protein VR611_13370 [Aquirufa nivalisilvae]
MKNLLLLACSLFVLSTASAQDTLSTKKITIPEGTVLKVKSLSAFDSKTVNEGDIVDFAVYEDLEINGTVAIKEGAIVNAFIESSEKAKGLGKQGSLKVQFNYTKAADGSKVPLRSTKGTLSGEGTAGSAIALAAVVSPLFLLKKGKEAKVTQGKMMEAYVSRDVVISIK